ncbi:hypothetical protein EG68_06554 [Paragonimus skrjabini miyazakii]|uniref:Uncharacterized protein n=1 Tax=Paragonimus skrjabini miyazakii TaxID=59628 RepID=A0A8S9YUP7_9TREM|nr:hypothetical protein EG68_06554 [Paragonimus skrjabini miyazakii]
MRPLTLILLPVIVLLGLHCTEAITVAEMEKKLKEILGNRVDDEMITGLAYALTSNYPDSDKQKLIDEFAKDENLPPDVHAALKKLVGNTGFRQTGSVILLCSLVMVHLLVF